MKTVLVEIFPIVIPRFFLVHGAFLAAPETYDVIFSAHGLEEGTDEVMVLAFLEGDGMDTQV